MVELHSSKHNLQSLHTPGYISNTLFYYILFISILSTTSTDTTHYLPEEHIHTIVKRSQVTSYENFKITNITFPCNGSQSSIPFSEIFPEIPQNVVLLRVHDLYENEMRDFMQYKGASEINENVASEEAEQEFQQVHTQRFRRVTQGYGPEDRLQQRIPGSRLTEERGDTRYRKRRQITGQLPTILRRERCINAGESNYDDPNYLHLCTFCTSRRRLPEDSYPTSVPEVYCSSSSTGCLGNNNGKCVSTIYNASLLRRKPNSCRLCMRDSQVLAVDEWEVYIEPIKVGCECMLDKNSDYKNRWFNNNGISNAVG